MSDPSEIPLEDYVFDRLVSLDSRIDKCRAELDSLSLEKERLTKIIRDHGLRRTGPAASSATTERMAPGSASTGGDEAHMTIKEKAVAVLSDHPEGLSTGAILDAILERFGGELNPKSLSPQLGRLRDKLQVRKDGDVWKLAQKNAG